MRLGLGFEWTIKEAFQREYVVASHFMAHPDFVTGVVARLVTKGGVEPLWTPRTIEETTEEDAVKFVTPTPGDQRLVLLREGAGANYREYPHAEIGLPSEVEVKSFLLEGRKLVERDLVRWFVDGRNGKLGVEAKVQDVVRRKTKTVDGFVKWGE